MELFLKIFFVEMTDLVRQLKERYDAKQFKVPDMVRATGINGDKIHKWLQGKGNPKPPEDKLVEDFLNGRTSIIPNKGLSNESITLDQMTALYSSLMNALKDINSNVLANLQVTQENNSLAHAALLSHAQIQGKSSDEIKQKLGSSLDYAKGYLEKFYGSTEKNKRDRVKKAH